MSRCRKIVLLVVVFVQLIVFGIGFVWLVGFFVKPWEYHAMMEADTAVRSLESEGLLTLRDEEARFSVMSEIAQGTKRAASQPIGLGFGLSVVALGSGIVMLAGVVWPSRRLHEPGHD